MSSDDQMQHKGAGRPRKSGNIALLLDVLFIFERLRSSGVIRDVAIKNTVDEVKKLHPGFAISDTEIKNILAKFQPENSLLFEAEKPDNWKMGVFRVVKQGDTYTMILADRQQFGKRGKQITPRKKFKLGQKKA